MKRLVKTLKGLWSLIVGLKITGVELVKPWITVHYPRQEVANLSSFRGHIELMPAADDPRTPRCAAKRVGKAIAELARTRNVEKVVFNRNGFLYHGRVKPLADAAREAGLDF